MSKVIAVANQKGGVGKTTSAVNIAAWLGAKGKKTLLVENAKKGLPSGITVNGAQGRFRMTLDFALADFGTGTNLCAHVAG